MQAATIIPTPSLTAMSNNLINYDRLQQHQDELKAQWNDAKKPFHYLVYDNFLTPEAAEQLLAAYPDVTTGNWDGTTYINQKNKFALTKFGAEHPLLQKAFDELNSEKFLHFVEGVTGIPNLIGDDELFGGGLHQSVTGAFLDVHVDFNYHQTTRHHRRMNAIVYMNKDWQKDYNGYLELWDMKTKKQLENIAPLFNRCVIFETNEVSYHGHPKPLAAPGGLTRKSMAVYYYTTERPAHEIAGEHNTVYVNTEGTGGLLKNLKSGLKAAVERVKK
ncbi:2OG-Fe(II) oxygenase [Hymenobacter siberiensis]|uniref:2OG-Fe(II) oxygenase n=1 Tax=Hymenobacter siberiensis TaxID=2848396 RepID=UPI001F27F749|nr:2OG-Fe(II) oxygenase [Hymenobacter siberiensis]